MDKEQLLTALRKALDDRNADELEKLSNQAINDFPDDNFGNFFLGEAFALRDDLANAQVCIAKCIKADPKNNNYILRLASLLEEMNEANDAMLLYGMALDNDEKDIRALIGLIRYYVNEEEDEDEAFEHLERALAIDANNPTLYSLKARAQLLAEDSEKALEEVNKGLAIKQTEGGLSLKINILSDLGQFDKMDQCYQDLIGMAGDNAFYRINYSQYLSSENRYDEAASHLEKVVEMDRASGAYNPLVSELLGVAYLEQGKHEDAIKVFDELVSKASDDWSAYVKRANAKIGMGDERGALADLKEASKYVSEASKLELASKEAELYVKFNKLGSAEKIYKDMARDEFYARDGFYGLGVIYHKAGKLDKGYKMMQQAAKRRHKLAESFIREHFQEQLAATEGNIIDKYESEFAKNSNSPTLKNLFGKLWTYDLKKNKLSTKIPAEIAKKLQEKVSGLSLMMTERGILVINPLEKQPINAVYKVEDEDNGEVEIEVAPLDGSTPYSLKLSASGDSLTFASKKGDSTMLKANSASAISSSDKKNVKGSISKADMEFLGDNAKALIEAIF